MIAHTLDHIFSFSGELKNPPEVIGPAPEGIRINFYCIGGDITGPKLSGRLLNGGGDWMTLRRDGVAVQDVRTTFKTDDGALILVAYSGLIDFGPNGYQDFLHNKQPATAKLRITPRFSTSHPNYQWLHRVVCLGVGEYTAADNVARYDVFAVN